MKRFGRAALLAVALAPVGCSSMSNTAAGTGIGAAVGTGAGLALGAATGNPRTGALAGGLIGAGVGGIAGSAADERDRERTAEVQLAQAEAAAANAPPPTGPLGMMDVVQLVQQGVGEEVIINQIRTTNSSFQLSATDISYLKTNNVPERVVIAMQNAKPSAAPVAIRRTPRTVIVEEPTVIYQRPYYPRPYYPRPYYWGPPPPPVGIGFTYIRR